MQSEKGSVIDPLERVQAAIAAERPILMVYAIIDESGECVNGWIMGVPTLSGKDLSRMVAGVIKKTSEIPSLITKNLPKHVRGTFMQNVQICIENRR